MAGNGQPNAPSLPTPDEHTDQQAAAPDWDALQDSLLGQILAAAGRECRSVFRIRQPLKSTFPRHSVLPATPWQTAACIVDTSLFTQTDALVLTRRGPPCRRAVTLTCKRWRRVYHLEPSLQPRFNLYFSPWDNRPPCRPPTQQQQAEVERRVARLARSAGLVAGDRPAWQFHHDDLAAGLPAAVT